MSVLLDGLSRQNALETELDQDGEAELQLFQALSAIHQSDIFACYAGTRKNVTTRFQAVSQEHMRIPCGPPPSKESTMLL